jgi:hypothetical protein
MKGVPTDFPGMLGWFELPTCPADSHHMEPKHPTTGRFQRAIQELDIRLEAASFKFDFKQDFCVHRRRCSFQPERLYPCQIHVQAFNQLVTLSHV